MSKTIVLKIDPKISNKEVIDRCAAAIRCGKLVVFPTETVYGIAANLQDLRAIDRLYRIKKRPKTKPFTVHISGLKDIRRARCAVTKEARLVIDKFWPGPLTIILRSKDGNKIGFRMPDNEVALELIRASSVPIVAPSANISGKTPPISATDVLKQLGGRIDVIIDAGRTDVGIESTVVDLTVVPPKILRKGAIKAKDIFRAMNYG